MAMRFGVHKPLEDEADRIIRESLAGVNSHSAKSDILTAWKYQDRIRREVLTRDGSPDPAVRKGMFHRRINSSRPELNSRDGVARARSISGSLRTHLDEHGVMPRD
jgi:hypothetical protein